MTKSTKSQHFETTILPHLDAAYNLARWLTHDMTDAEDVVQEAFLKAFRHFDGFRGGDSLSWTLKIVRHTCYSWLDKNRPRMAMTEFDDEQHSTHAPDAEALMIENIDRDILFRLVAGLPEEFREVFVLREIEGLSYKEIAVIADLPLGTVMSRLARARRRLQIGLMSLRGVQQ